MDLVYNAIISNVTINITLLYGKCSVGITYHPSITPKLLNQIHLSLTRVLVIFEYINKTYADSNLKPSFVLIMV